VRWCCPHWPPAADAVTTGTSATGFTVSVVEVVPAIETALPSCVIADTPTFTVPSNLARRRDGQDGKWDALVTVTCEAAVVIVGYRRAAAGLRQRGAIVQCQP